MLFIDLASSISRALPRLAVDAAGRAGDDKPFEPDIGYGFFRQDKLNTTEPFNFGRSGGWSVLRSSTLGILGTGPIAQAVARIADQWGAEVVCHHSAPSPGSESGHGAWGDSFGDVMAARVICVVLPWPEHLSAHVEWDRLAPVNPHTVLVVWKRSIAIERAIAHLAQHYIEPVQLCNLAKVACISKFHLVRLFTSTLGISPHRYQLLLRLAHAKAMLREGFCITRIAQNVGFGDHSHLDRSFRVLVGMTPTQYQRALAL